MFVIAFFICYTFFEVKDMTKKLLCLSLLFLMMLSTTFATNDNDYIEKISSSVTIKKITKTTSDGSININMAIIFTPI